jgi:hypothetical protein
MDVDVIVDRVYLPTETLGSLYFNGKLMCKTMELPWKDNQRSVSCIPEGVYEVTKEAPIPANDPKGRKERPYWHFRIHNVPGRSGVLIHKITYVSGLKGCIGVGKQHFDVDGDGVPDIIQSSAALQELVATLPDKFMMLIKQKAK